MRAGDRCAVEPYLDCGECPACRRGRGNCCERLRVLGVHVDGGMREWLHVPARKLHPSATLDLDTLALVETLSIGAHAVRRAPPATRRRRARRRRRPDRARRWRPSRRAAGADVAVMDVNDARLAFCRSHLGVTRTLQPAGDETPGAVRDVFGELPLVVFDATGHRDRWSRRSRSPAHGGTLVFVGLVQADVTLPRSRFPPP